MNNVILYQPEKPANTGNILRTISATGSKLHIIGPLQFELSDESLKRAGMDYITTADFIYYENYELNHEQFLHLKVFLNLSYVLIMY